MKHGHTWRSSAITRRDHLFLDGDNLSACTKGSRDYSLPTEAPANKCSQCVLLSQALSHIPRDKARKTGGYSSQGVGNRGEW